VEAEEATWRGLMGAVGCFAPRLVLE